MNSSQKSQHLYQLQSFLNQNEIPDIKGKPKTFLGIAKQPHYENVLSNIYAFYFNVNEVHKLKDLFIKSLLELINTSTLSKDNTVFEMFSDYDVFTEYGTTNQKRIDILLLNNEQAIIIENKVYHHLNNDLDEYYKEVTAENKMGIILSLFPVSNINHKHFINITHLQLLNKIISNLGNYVLKANDKYIVFLKDFYQNIINLSHSFMDKESITFYYKNQQDINQLTKCKFQLRDHIVSEVVKAGQTLDNINVLEPRVNSFNDKRLVYFVSPYNKNLMLTVVYEKLLTNERTMHIAVELQGDLLKDRNSYNVIQFTEDEHNEAFANHFKTTAENWSHFSVKHYVPDESEVTNLSQFILNKLEQDHLLSIFRKLELFCKQL